MLLLLRSAIARRTLAGSLCLSTALAACAAQAASFTIGEKRDNKSNKIKNG